MKLSGLALAFLCIVFFVHHAQAQEKWSRVKIAAPIDNHARAQLIGLLEIDHFHTDERGFVVTELSETAVAHLKNTAYHFEVLVPDVARQLDSLNRIYFDSINRRKKLNMLGRVAIEQPGSTLDKIIPMPNAFEVKSSFGGYYSFGEMEAAMNTLVATYPSIAQKTSIGKTYEGRDIWVIKISDNVATDESNEPEVLFLGLQHAREAITGASMIFFMQYLCEQYGKDDRIKDLVNNREFFIIPCFNPDGWEYNRTSMNGNGGGGWRKNRRPISGTTYGVDLNRNWGVDWANCSAPIQGPASSCGSSSPSVDTYWGPAPFSENETFALSEFVKSHHIVAGFDQHAFGPYYSLPFGRQALHTMTEKGKNFFTAVPALMGKYNGMRAADSYDALGYEVAGGFKDWMLIGDLGTGLGTGRKDTVWAITGEGGAGGGTGGDFGSFWAPAAQIVNLCKGMVYQNLQFAFAAGTYVDIQDISDIVLTSKTGTLGFRVKRLGLGNEQVNVKLIPLENIIGGGTVTIDGMSYYEDYERTINYTLPAGISNGQRIKFIWRVETSGYSYSDTIVKIYNPTFQWADDMEGSQFNTNWSSTDGWNYSIDNAYSGKKSLTESPGTNYTSSSERIVTLNQKFNLANNTAAYLTFWTRHRAENFRDRMIVQVGLPANGNKTTWKTVPGLSTIQEPGSIDGSTIDGEPSLTGIQDYWTRELFDLSSFKSSAVSLRFVFASNARSGTFKYQEDDGFYIDDLKVIRTDATFIVLPIEFLSFSGKLLPEGKVQLAWEANTNAEHHYFEVERSNDGSHFIVLGKVPQMSAFQFLDQSPRSGNNYYRIKQVDKDGTVTYSKIINVYLESAVKVTVFPNPVNDLLTIKLDSRQAQTYKIQVTDLQGRVLYDVFKNINSSNAELKVNTRSWKPQLYIIRVMNNHNEVLQTQKVLKL